MSEFPSSSSWPPFFAEEVGEATGAARRPWLVLGLGNDILSDDAVGLKVAAEVRRGLPAKADVEVLEVCEMGLALLDLIVGCRELILIDSIQTGSAAPGTLHEITDVAAPTHRAGSPHFLGVGETLALGRWLELPMPERVRVLAIEVADPFTLSTELTPAVAAAVPKAARRVREWLAEAPFRPSASPENPPAQERDPVT
jgi:hydrogenase maturation protease